MKFTPKQTSWDGVRERSSKTGRVSRPPAEGVEERARIKPLILDLLKKHTAVRVDYIVDKLDARRDDIITVCKELGARLVRRETGTWFWVKDKEKHA